MRDMRARRSDREQCEPVTLAMPVEGAAVLAGSVGGSFALLGGALALGIRHGIDWDHIAAITDITSTTATADQAEDWLTREPGVLVTDESHHRQRASPEAARAAVVVGVAAEGDGRPASRRNGDERGGWRRHLARQRRPLLYGTLYALGHGAVVMVLGLIAILASGFLPEWIDPIMRRVVGATLLLLAVYLYYSIYRYFRGGEFRIRSRWMLVFSGMRAGYGWLQAKLQGHEYHRVAHANQYGSRTAFGVGMIHGVGAETGTQVLVIATAVGAGSNAAGVVALFAFVLGLLISNSFVTIATTTGFVSAERRQRLYVIAGVIAATFSLMLGLLFLADQEGLVPNLD